MYPGGHFAHLASRFTSKTPLFRGVDAHTILCLFSTNCEVSTHRTAGVIPLFSGMSGKAWLRARTFRDTRDSPAAGNRGYQYQVDLTQAASLAEAPCVTDCRSTFVRSSHCSTAPPFPGMMPMGSRATSHVWLACS